MNNKELKALISLLEDDDSEVRQHVLTKLRSFGKAIIPHLEEEWETIGDSNAQSEIEDLIHSLQFEKLQDDLQVWKDGDQKDLLYGMWLIASYQYPDVTFDELKSKIEQIYYEAWLSFKPDAHPRDQIKSLNSVLLSKLKFSGIATYAPGNSMINIVLDSKKGNPISLGVIYMLVAQKLKLPVYGVNFPNIFILKYESKLSEFYINVFSKGSILTHADIENYLKNSNITPRTSFFATTSHIEILKRVFRNLVVSFEKLEEFTKVDEVKTMLKILQGGDVDHDLLG